MKLAKGTCVLDLPTTSATLCLLISEVFSGSTKSFIVGFFSPKGRQITWDYFKDNFDMVVERLGGFLLPRVVEVQSLYVY